MEKIVCCFILVICLASCKTKDNTVVVKRKEIKTELFKFNTLLRDTNFATSIAEAQESSYYTKQGQVAPAFFSGKDSVINKSFKEEKIAINLAGFYGLECGIGALMESSGKTPVELLQQVVNRTLDSTGMVLLNRFANATWKAGQPFRDLNRITRDNFVVASLLSETEIKKDEDQVLAAASILLDSLKNVNGASREAQLEKINQLLKSKQFAFEMAAHLEAAYYAGQNKPAPDFISAKEDLMTIPKSAREEKVATNLAGFYALECGIGYLATTQNMLPSDILNSIVNDSINGNEKKLLERFANATWKAGQPFRSLDRITRDIFMPFDLLPEAEVLKDWYQIKSAAVMVQKSFKE